MAAMFGPIEALEPDEYLLHDRRSDARSGVSVSGPRCDGDTGTDTDPIMDDDVGVRHRPDGVNSRWWRRHEKSPDGAMRQRLGTA